MGKFTAAQWFLPVFILHCSCLNKPSAIFETTAQQGRGLSYAKVWCRFPQRLAEAGELRKSFCRIDSTYKSKRYSIELYRLLLYAFNKENRCGASCAVFSVACLCPPSRRYAQTGA